MIDLWRGKRRRRMVMDKPTIFFSHSSKDRDLILPIKNKLADITSGTMDIVMSSDGQSIPFGRNWVSKIEEGLGNAQIMFVFVTPNSIKSEWIYFEAGYAYSKDIEVIPVGIGVHIGELKAPLNLLQGFDILSHDSMNNFISVINKRFSLSFKEDFSESDFSLICKEINKEKLDIEILDIIEGCECDYYLVSESSDATQFYNKIIPYLKHQNIKYSYSDNELLIKGIKMSKTSASKTDINTWKIFIKFRLSSINLRESFEQYVNIMRFLEQKYLTLRIDLGNKFCCICKDENISSMISGNDFLTLYPNKVGTFQYKDIDWRVEKNIGRECQVIIGFKIEKADFEVIINFFDYLYKVGIIHKIDDEQLDL